MSRVFSIITEPPRLSSFTCIIKPSCAAHVSVFLEPFVVLSADCPRGDVSSTDLRVGRYGALRMSQVALVLLGCGIAVAAEGSLSGFGASAIIGGGAVSTPTSSQLLAGLSIPPGPGGVFNQADGCPGGPADQRFSRPEMAHTMGWRGAALATAAACGVFAAMMQPLRARDKTRGH
jgi:hypothetical protein